jgi:hypothetical protein
LFLTTNDLLVITAIGLLHFSTVPRTMKRPTRSRWRATTSPACSRRRVIGLVHRLEIETHQFARLQLDQPH